MKGDIPSKKKIPFKINEPFRTYLKRYSRDTQLPIQYDDLLRSSTSVSLLDAEGNDTLWETVYYEESDRIELDSALTKIYALLKTDGDFEVLEHLSVARVDYCTFGNTKPFRVRVINRLNDNYDHFYVKKADASRLYGLELEDLLSLLGDMRAYNFVVDITPDIEGSQFRIRAIDFDQQSYEGRKSFYLPQYFKENNPIIFLGVGNMSKPTVTQYQLEERSMIAARVKRSRQRINHLLRIMVKDTISDDRKVNQLKKELAYHHKAKSFLDCKTMGEIVLNNIQLLLAKDFKQSILYEE